MTKHSKGMLIFVLISISSIVFIFFWNDISLQLFISSISSISAFYLILILLLLFVYMFFEGFRTKVILHALGKRLSVLQSAYSVLANELFSAITPFQSGGQPFEIYVLKKSGVSIAHGASVAYFRMVFNVFFLFLFSLIAFLSYDNLLYIPFSSFLYLYSLFFMLYFFLITVLMIFKPFLAKKLLFLLIKYIFLLKFITKLKMYKILKSSIQQINLFNVYVKAYVSNYFHLIITFFLTALLYVFKFLIMYVLLMSFGFYAKLDKVIFFQSLIQFVNYAFPTPGASGSTEIFALNVFRLINNTSEFNAIISVFIFLWRFFTYHIIIIIAFISSLRWKLI